MINLFNFLYRTNDYFKTSFSLEEFTEKLRHLPSDKKEQQALELIGMAPVEMKPEEIVDLILRICYQCDIPFLLDALHVVYPSFTLSPCDFVRVTIARDDRRQISKKDFLNLLSKSGISNDSEKVAACCAIADHFFHPHILSVERFKIILQSSEKKEEKIVENAPIQLKPEEIVTLIFENAPHWSIPRLLRAVEKIYPEFKLSHYDTIRKAITEDTLEYRLRNADLETMFEERYTEKKKQELYDLAYQCDHPYLFRRAQILPLSLEYTLNFPWMNLNPQERETNSSESIFDNGGLYKEKEKDFISHIVDWADKNPSTRINLWTDSAILTQRAWDQTAEKLQEISVAKGVDLRLRDIRQLSNVEGEIEKALHPATPLFFRVDLCKALIVDHMLSSSEGSHYSIVLDGDIEAMTAEEIFDERTLGYLANNGYVFNRVGLNNFENNFMIFDKENDQVRQIHRDIVLGDLAQKITHLRNVLYPGQSGNSLLHSQSVFNQYDSFKRVVGEGVNKPRKVVKCPSSQFNFGGTFFYNSNDHRNEKWRFIDKSDMPYTIKGRSGSYSEETMIEHLVGWRSEPLNTHMI
jgi:hypothetical protein